MAYLEECRFVRVFLESHDPVSLLLVEVHSLYKHLHKVLMHSLVTCGKVAVEYIFNVVSFDAIL